MKKVCLFNTFLVLLLGLGLLLSCEKEALDISQSTLQSNMKNEEQIANSRNSTRELDRPTVTRDRYKFRDFEHLTAYYKALDAIYDKDDQEFNMLIARNEGISSVHTKLANDEFLNPKDRYQPFLTDPIMMSIVNEFFEFQVGKVLVTYMNNEEILICAPDDRKTQAEIRAITKGNKLNIKTIPNKAWWGTDTNVVSFRSWCGCNIDIEQISCNEVRVFGACKGLFWGDGGGTINIFLTNNPFFPTIGTVPPLQTHQVDGNFEFIIPMNNLTGTNIHASADPDCFAGNLATTSLGFDPNGSSCDSNERTTGYLWAQDNGSQGYSHRTSTYKNWIRAYEEAKIWSKWWDGTKWKSNKADLEVTIDATRKNPTCSPFDQEDEKKTCFCKDKRARINAGINSGNNDTSLVNYCDGDVIGTYKKSLSWNGMNWSIDAVGEVDFECCE